MTVLALEQLHYSLVEIHNFWNTQVFQSEWQIKFIFDWTGLQNRVYLFIWRGCKDVCWTLCSFVSLYLRVIKSRMSKVEKRKFMVPGKTIQLPSVSHTCGECMRLKKNEGKGRKSSYIPRFCHCIYRWDGQVKYAQTTINPLAEIIFRSKPLFFNAKSSCSFTLLFVK